VLILKVGLKRDIIDDRILRRATTRGVTQYRRSAEEQEKYEGNVVKIFYTILILLFLFTLYCFLFL